MIINQIINMETESTTLAAGQPLPPPLIPWEEEEEEERRVGDLEKNTKICRIIFNTIEATAETGGGRVEEGERERG